MGLFKGGALRIFQSALYALAFGCAAVILGIYSFFLAVLSDHHRKIANDWKAVEGISGIAVIYTVFAVVLTCCLGGVSFFAFLGIVLDILFLGAFLGIAILTREGASSCKGTVSTPLGTGNSNSLTSGYGSDTTATYKPKLGTACRLNTAVFAVSIIGAFLFLCTALMQLALIRNHKKEKRYGPSPANNYTSGSGKNRKFWQRKNKNVDDSHLTRDAEVGAAGVGAGGLAAGAAHEMRPSHDTAYTGTTVNGGHDHHHGKRDAEIGAAGVGAAGLAHHEHNKHQNNNATYNSPAGNVGTAETTTGHAPHGAHGGYYTQPQGTGVNPYGYENSNTNHNDGTYLNYNPNERTTGTATNF